MSIYMYSQKSTEQAVQTSHYKDIMVLYRRLSQFYHYAANNK